MTSFDAIVLAGGTSTRMGGTDKLIADIDGTTVLDRALHAVSEARTVVAVGPELVTDSPVRWTRELPWGGGPLAAISAGFSALDHVQDLPIAILAGDVPFASDAIVALLAALGTADVALATDSEGRDQYLLAVWNRRALGSRLGKASGSRRARALYSDVEAIRVGLSNEIVLDVDTTIDLTAARQQSSRQGGE